jgi:hypothetical protein
MPDYMQAIPIWFYPAAVLVGVVITLVSCMPTKWVEKLMKTLDRKFGRL